MDLKRHIKGALGVLLGMPERRVTATVVINAAQRRLEECRILLTGGTRGLGRAMAQRFVQEGARVVITGRDEAKTRAVADEIGALGMVLDVADTDALLSALDRAGSLLGDPVDTLVSNAGISLHEGDITRVTSEQFDTQIAVNLRAPYFLAQQFIQLRQGLGGGGNMLFVSSERGSTAEDLPYGLTKAAVNSLVQSLAYIHNEIGGIRFNAIAPGITATDMTGFSAEGNLVCGSYPKGRIYLPCEVAEVACFLLSEAAGCLSGQIIVCNNAATVNSSKKH